MAKKIPQKTANPSAPRKRRVLLAMGFANHQRQAGVVRFARNAGWVVDSRLSTFHAMNRDKEYLGSSRYDGVLTLMSRLAPWMPDLVRSLNVPVVDMWADYVEEKYPRVLLDHPAAGKLGAEHLLSRGFRDLLFYTHEIEGKASIWRREGFKAATLAAGARFHELTWDHTAPGEAQNGARIAWLANALLKMPLPLAVMGANDHIAAEVLEAAEVAGLQVPRQIAVMGIDNDPLITDLTLLPLSSVDTCREEAGYQAAALLDRLMSGEPAPASPILVPPGRIVTRRSTDVLAVRDSDVANAIQFIQEHFAEPITVAEVANVSMVSRRHLQDRFLAETGQTISKAILNQRLEHAKKLLAETRSKAHWIATQSGFRTGERLSKVFRQLTGMTPQQFRERNAGSAQQLSAP